MRLILPQGAVDFDTLGAMLGAFLLDEDTTALMPSSYAPQCAPLIPLYLHKLPFSLRENWIDPSSGKPQLSQWGKLALGMDFLQSLQVTKWLQAEDKRLDPFYASVLLTGIYSSGNRLASFTIDDETYSAIEYLVRQGADEKQVKDWLAGTHQVGLEMPQLHAMELAKIYQNRIPAWQRMIQKIIYQNAWELGMRVYLVGGGVRDLLLNRKSRDMDFIVEGSAILLARSLTSHYGGELVVHQPFGTARWDLNDALEHILKDIASLSEEEINQIPDSIDLISARTEWYPQEGQLPRVRFDGIELDMQRRDFSVNTLALRIEADQFVLIDTCNGLPDLDNKLIRALHPRSFIDDPTRLFRAVRYEQRLKFHIEPLTLQWMKEGLEKMAVVSGDRIRHEINLWMAEDDLWKNFQRAMTLNILPAVHPAWKTLDPEWEKPLRAVLKGAVLPGWDLNFAVDHMSVRELAGYAILLQRISPENIRQIATRLHFSASQTDQLVSFNELYSEKDELRELTSSRFTFKLEHLNDAMLYAFYILWQDDHELCRKILGLRDVWRNTTAAIDGNDLHQLGIKPGPIYARLLKSLRAARIDGTLVSREEQIAFVKKWLSSSEQA